jgi:hypothetical protein
MNRTIQKTSAMTHTAVLEKKTTNVLPAGKYFIGDLSYFLPSTYWKSGHYAIPDGRGFISFRVSSGLWSADRTSYTAESKNFGICSYELGDKSLWTGDGTFHTFVEPVSVAVDDDSICFSSGTKGFTLTYMGNMPSDDEGYDSWS